MKNTIASLIKVLEKREDEMIRQTQMNMTLPFFKRKTVPLHYYMSNHYDLRFLYGLLQQAEWMEKADKLNKTK